MHQKPFYMPARYFLHLFFALIILCCSTTQAQTIITISGSGLSTDLGDGAPASTAAFGAIGGGVFDINNNFLFTEGPGNRCRKISRFGIIDSAVGNGLMGFYGDNGLAIRAKMNGVKEAACDKHGNWYVADAGNQRIRKIDVVTHIITTIVGTGAYGYSGDGGPATAAPMGNSASVCVDDTGNVYFSDDTYHIIRKIDTFGIIHWIAGTPTIAGTSGDGGPATSAQIGDINYLKLITKAIYFWQALISVR